tara:strand:- start:435 stop:644 length:210 start_codon:yes stop_codon:yes gene_type:complete
MSKQIKIDIIAQGIMAGYYGSKQNAGTEFQKWTYAVLQAMEIYKQDMIINVETLSNEAYHYCKNNNLIQ